MFGDVAQCGVWALKSSIVRSVVTHWDDMETTLHHMYFIVLRAATVEQSEAPR